MTKSDLKDFMLVETRDGIRFIFINGNFRNEWSYLSLNSFNEDLNYTSDINSLDMVKIYSASDCLTYDTTNRKLLWERKEKMTNIERIHNMNAEELVNFLVEVYSDGSAKEEFSYTQEWLKSEVKDEQ